MTFTPLQDAETQRFVVNNFQPKEGRAALTKSVSVPLAAEVLPTSVAPWMH